ncbi:hypothetical protein LSH36_236g00037 [Paralvinella palmiformis]|uniref:Uncharacterized protein n=1 Tax=Paralvinella palmiformis TaxID=53620 RepID=A0AAD9JLT3_9ANNE|nr:hypothetical protein LSH36_236g00037 [Paralvinella palmiformis]
MDVKIVSVLLVLIAGAMAKPLEHGNKVRMHRFGIRAHFNGMQHRQRGGFMGNQNGGNQQNPGMQHGPGGGFMGNQNGGNQQNPGMQHRPGGGIMGNFNGGNQQKPGPPGDIQLADIEKEPVTYEDMQNLAAWIKATITGLSQLLKDNAQLIAMDADPTDELLANNLGQFVDNVKDLVRTDMVTLREHVMRTMAKQAIYGIMGESPCADETECSEREEELENLIEDAFKENGEAPIGADLMGKRRGGRGDKTDREIVEVLHLLKGGLTYLTGNNNELANAIATGMTCLSGTLDEISSYIDPSNLPQDKIDLIPIMARLVVVVYEVIPQMHEAVEKIELIKTFKEFKHNGLLPSDVIDEVSDKIPKMVSVVNNAEENIAHLLARATLLGYEGHPACNEYFSIETFDQFANCAKEALFELKKKGNEVKEKLKTIINSAKSNNKCQKLESHLASLYDIVEDVKSAKSFDDSDNSKSAEFEALDDIDQMEAANIPELVLSDLECLGDIVDRLVVIIDLDNTDLQELLIESATFLHFLKKTGKKVLMNIEMVVMSAIMSDRIDDIVIGDQKKAKASTRMMTKGIHAALRQLAAIKLPHGGPNPNNNNDQSTGQDSSPNGDQSPGQDSSPSGDQLKELIRKLGMALGHDSSPNGDQSPGQDSSPSEDQRPGQDSSPSGDQSPGQDSSPNGDQSPGQDSSPSGDQMKELIRKLGMALGHDSSPNGDQSPGQDSSPNEDQRPGQDSSPSGDQSPGQDSSPNGDQSPGQDSSPSGDQMKELIRKLGLALGHDSSPNGDQSPGQDSSPNEDQRPGQDSSPSGDQMKELIRKLGLALGHDSSPNGDQSPGQDSSPSGDQMKELLRKLGMA